MQGCIDAAYMKLQEQPALKLPSPARTVLIYATGVLLEVTSLKHVNMLAYFHSLCDFLLLCDACHGSKATFALRLASLRGANDCAKMHARIPIQLRNISTWADRCQSASIHS